MKITQEQKFYAEVVNRAWEDAEFKKELIANPVAAIEKLTGKKVNLPEGKKIVVRDQTCENKLFINIPAVPEVDVELNEEELEAVAGGCAIGSNNNPVIYKPTTPTPNFPDEFTISF